MESVPYDIIYEIFKNVTDYSTALNFFILDKTFYHTYIKNRKSVMISIIKLRCKEIMDIIEKVPELLPIEIILLNTNLYPIYFMYFNVVYNSLIQILPSSSIYTLTQAIILNGFDHLDKNIAITISENGTISLKMKNLKGLLTYKTKYPFLLIKKKMSIFESKSF